MSHLQLKILEILEDVDTEGKPRLRLKVQEATPRTLNVNLKNANADKVNQLRALVGGVAMLPIKEGMMNGSTFFQLLVDDEIIPIRKPEPVPTSKTVHLEPNKQDHKPDLALRS
jgi:hypothetical protein